MALLTLIRHGQASYLQQDYDKLSALGERSANRTIWTDASRLSEPLGRPAGRP